MTAVVDTSALQALLVQEDADHPRAVRYWEVSADDDLVTHNYVVVETIALVRKRLGWEAVEALHARLLPAVRVEMVDRSLHDDALTAYLTARGGTSFTDRVTIEFARRNRIAYAFGFDRDLLDAGLAFPPLRRPSA